MKTAVLCGIALACSSAAFAQTSAASPSSPAAVTDAPKTLTFTGCVGGGTNNQPITLANALVIPSADAAGETPTSPSPVPGAVSRPGTQPPAAVGTSGTTGAPTAPPTAVGTSGTITGTAPAGSSTSSITGYRLGGADMTSWVGRRVEIVGAVVPAAATQGAATTGSAASSTIAMPEFRVISVKPVTGNCPER